MVAPALAALGLLGAQFGYGQYQRSKTEEMMAAKEAEQQQLWDAWNQPRARGHSSTGEEYASRSAAVFSE
jgi:hypothetical protein